MIKQLQTDKRMVSILESIDKTYPGLFFHYLPTGSLVERFGKTLPSSSILASDYDVMLIPKGITVGMEEYDTFRPIPISEDENEYERKKGFLWLDLNDCFLSQWEKFCLPRRIMDIQNKECKLLSTYHLKGITPYHSFDSCIHPNNL